MLDNFALMVILSFLIFLISFITFTLFRVSKGITESNFRMSSVRNHFYQSRNRRKNDFYNRLFFGRNPFSWRIGFALAYAGFSNEEIKRFKNSLDRVLSKEKEIVKRMDENAPLSLSKFIKPFWKKSNTNTIERYIDQFKSHIIIEESNEKDTLEYLLEYAVGNFSIAVQEIQRNKEMEPPF